MAGDYKATAAPATVRSKRFEPDTGPGRERIDVAEGFICGCHL